MWHSSGDLGWAAGGWGFGSGRRRQAFLRGERGGPDGGRTHRRYGAASHQDHDANPDVKHGAEG